MAKVENKKAKVINGGKLVEVYPSKTQRDTWIDYMDCNTTYHASELKFLN